MKLKLLLSLLALAAAIAAPITQAQTVVGSGGTLSAPLKDAIGQNIGAGNISLTTSDGTTASLTCEITEFGIGTYQWNWQCDNGFLYIDGQAVAALSGGHMTFGSCSGGGRGGHPTVCYMNFTAMATADDGSTGTISVLAKRGPYVASSGITILTGTVLRLTASW